MRITSFGQSDIGRVREHNEDAYVCCPEAQIWIVADGMGGHASGEVASDLTCKVVTGEHFKHQELPVAIEIAHQYILKAAKNGLGSLGMGSTVVALTIKDCQFHVSWVGDSRAYHYSDKLERVTRDHSYVQELIDSGAIDEHQARSHPQRNIITQSVGSQVNPTIHVDSQRGQFLPGNKILLCSDGLTGEIDDEQIELILQTTDDDKKLIKRLIETAKQKGGKDNITAIVVSAPLLNTQLTRSFFVNSFFQALSPFSSILIPLSSFLIITTIYQLIASLF